MPSTGGQAVRGVEHGRTLSLPFDRGWVVSDHTGRGAVSSRGRASAGGLLSLDDLLEIAEGNVEGVQVRDLGLLASAAARPQMSVFGEDAYPTLVDKAAALMHSIARNHCLIDGNLRLAWSATRVFLIMNNADLAHEIDDAEQLVLGVARGELDVSDLAADFSRHLR